MRRIAFVLAVVALSSGCGGDDRSKAVVCRASDRDVLVDAKLERDVPSDPFVVDTDDNVWIGVIADSDVSSSAIASRVTGLFVIDDGDSVEYSRDETGAVVTEAAYLAFDEQGQFVEFALGPGAYRLWSIKSPEVQVVRCPAIAG